MLPVDRWDRSLLGGRPRLLYEEMGQNYAAGLSPPRMGWGSSVLTRI